MLTISVCFRYHICDIIVKPVTSRDKCSFVELVAHQDRQDPIWFVSHFWGTPFDQTVQMLSFHAEVHDLGEDTTYWYCTLANVSTSYPCCALLWFTCGLLQNQHDLSQLAGGLRQTPFWLAIQLPSCVGVVQAMDSKCTPPRRIWCVLEVCIHCTLVVSVTET